MLGSCRSLEVTLLRQSAAAIRLSAHVSGAAYRAVHVIFAYPECEFDGIICSIISR